ncbi:efflux RND transporter permease subunit [bacterium]|nr:efflux RND transporter permease subunit [bacterium]
MKKIAQFSTDYPITVLMFVLAIFLLGYISFSKLGMDLFPDMNNPRIFIELTSGERPPEEIEKQFVKSIESLSIQQKGAVNVSSVSRTGSAQITVEYAWDTNMDEAFLDLQRTLTSSSQSTDIDELTISQHDPNATPIIVLGLSHPTITDMDELRMVAENYLRNELIRMEGIADVKLLGQEEKEVIVETNDYLLQAYGVTPSTIASRITEYNRNISGGSVVDMGLKYIIKGVGELQSLEDIQNIIVTYKSAAAATGAAATQSSGTTTEKTPVFLKDIAKISFQNKKPDNIVRVNGKRCIGLAIYKETKYNTVNIVKDFLSNLETLRKALPGYDLTVIQNKGQFITNSINEVKQSALIGILFAVLVLYVFLRRFGATAIISAAIPISIVATFNMMYFKGLTLNIMTLGGLALGAGMLVDNAIVVMENIFRNLESGLSLREAAIDGTSQVSGAITASTITTIVVFLPIVYLHGTAGELFKDQAWTVAFSLLSSLVVAMLIIPMLSTRFLRTSAHDKKQSIRFPFYKKFLEGVLRIKWIMIILTVLMMVLAWQLIPLVGSEFMPKSDMNEYSIDLKLPEGTELYRTDSVVQNIETRLKEALGSDLQMTYSVIGPSAEISGESSILADENTASISLTLDAKHTITSDAVFARINAVLADIPDIETQVRQVQTELEMTLGTETAPIVIEIQGEDLDQLQALTEQAKQQVASIGELYNVETSFDKGRPEVEIVLDRVRAGLLNIGINTLSSQLTTQLTGVDAGQWDNQGEMRDIVVKLPDVTLSQLDNITIDNNGEKIPLYDITEIRNIQAPVEINRENQVRIGKITANINKTKPLDQVVAEIHQKMNAVSFPPEYSYVVSGEEQKRREAFDNLKFALILSLVLVYMVLASQFESLIHPFTILLSIPLAGVGAILIFFVLGKSLNIMAYIGLIMLVGIAVNDSIILVDAILQLQREGRTRMEAIIEAGQRRIRPIIMTSLTTILALLPMTFGFGEGSELRSPMALAVIGGLISSTVLTLVVIPCVFHVLDSLREKAFPKPRQ